MLTVDSYFVYRQAKKANKLHEFESLQWFLRWMNNLKYLEVEVQYNDHLPVTGLEDGVFDVVVKNVDFITTD